MKFKKIAVSLILPCLSLLGSLPALGTEQRIRTHNPFTLKAAAGIGLAACAATAKIYKNYQEYRKQLTWNWKAIEQQEPFPARASDFPENFLWGVGTSAYQTESGCDKSTYSQPEWQQRYPDKVGDACEHNLRYKEDIQLIKQLGVHTYRFSIEWSKIEPQEGTFNKQAMMHYVNVCKELLANNIRPVIGFHHYSDPQWFMDKGGFEKEENIKLYVRFCTNFFEALAQELPELFESTTCSPYFLTFNSPASYAANGYYTGNRPPGRKGDMKAQLTVLKNMLEAHVQVYQEIKTTDAGKKSQIGITHNIYQLDPANWFNPIAHLKCYFGNILTHTSVYEFFRTGVFDAAIPAKASVKHTNKLAPKSLDFIGLNYYCHGYMGLTGSPQPGADDQRTDNPMYSLYAEGLYRAIKELSDNLAKPLGIPIIVTENGIGTTDNALRDKFLKRYIFALSKALKDGYNVKGYIHWSLMDNYEWGNYTMAYGIYAIDFYIIDKNTGKPALKRTLKKGAQYFVDVVHEYKKREAQEKVEKKLEQKQN